MILELIRRHRDSYPGHAAADRLRQLDMRPSDASRLECRRRERAARESAIPEADVAAAVGFILEHPDVGAERVRLSLIDREEALIGTVFLNEARKQTAQLVEEHYRERREHEKLLEAELRARRQIPGEYRHVRAEGPNHIWAIDFTVIRFLSFRLVLCVVMDVFSQAYLAVDAGTGCDRKLAEGALHHAVARAGRRAGVFMRRDCGSCFTTASFQDLLAGSGITDAPIPPGQPWLNGTLESGNTSLKDAVRTAALLSMPEENERFHAGRRGVRAAVDLLQDIGDRVRVSLNEEIARPKFRTTPAKVLAGEAEVDRERRKHFIERSKAERRERMQERRRQPDRPPGEPTFIGKVIRAVTDRIRSMSTDRLFVVNEALHRRYRAVET